VTVDVDALVARLQALEDREAVRETWLDYCTQIDLADMDRLGDVFTEDAVLEVEGLGRALDGTFRGRRSIIDDFYAATASPAGPPGSTTAMTGHLAPNMRVDVDGDEAVTLGYFLEIVDDDLVLVGTYQHRMRRQPDRWRIAFKRIVVRYRARLQATSVRGRPLTDIRAADVGGAPGIGRPG
jgi:ketosteroid isomerase-like protein